jgi:phosphoribosylformylglycinamidine (FGAM) synthase PurS component
MAQTREFSFGITVMPRSEVLDTQGRAVEATLKREGEPVISCRVGRFIELKVSALTIAEAEVIAKKISSGLLANTLIETFELKLLN